MQSSVPSTPVAETGARASIHPLVKVAAVSIIAASGVAIWAMTSHLHSDVSAASAPAGTVAAAGDSTGAAPYQPAPVPAASTPAEPAHPAAPAPHHPTSASSKPPVTSSHPANGAAPAPYQGPMAANEVPPPPKPVAAIDPNLGRIESISMTEKKGEGKGVGVVAGGAVGGLVGNMFGSGNGKTAATVLGVVGGAVAGNEIEKQARSVKTWHITVHMDDGSTRTFTQGVEPAWHNGDQVRVVDGKLAYPDGRIPAPPAKNTGSQGVDTSRVS